MPTDKQIINTLEAENAILRQNLSHTKAKLEEARKLLGDALKAVESLDENSLGSVPDTDSQQGWFIRDELAHKIGSFLSKQQSEE